MRVLITRPRQDAEAVARLLRDRSIESLIEPLLVVTNLALSDFPLDGVQAVLLTSANGARALAQATTRRDVLCRSRGGGRRCRGPGRPCRGASQSAWWTSGSCLRQRRCR
jgi:uroporphyrinogen-III synthase